MVRGRASAGGGRRGRSKARARTRPIRARLHATLSSQLSLPRCVVSLGLLRRPSRRPSEGYIYASRGPLPLGRRWPSAMRAARSRCAPYRRCFPRGRGLADLDVIGRAAGRVHEVRCFAGRRVSAVPHALPLLLRASPSTLVDPPCTGILFATSVRCCHLMVDEINVVGWAGCRWARRWVPWQFLPWKCGAERALVELVAGHVCWH